MDERQVALPTQVRKRGGRLEPFSREKVAGALYAALTSLGAADAFLAGELADSVVHFLCLDDLPDPLPSTRIAETVIKVVHELGQPGLAWRFDLSGRERRRLEPAPSGRALPGPLSPADQIDLVDWIGSLTGPDLDRQCGQRLLEHVAGPAIYPRHLWAAHQEGLLRLGGLSHPNRLAEWTTRLAPVDVLGLVARSARLVGRRLDLEAVDVELALADLPLEAVDDVVRQAAHAADAFGLELALHLQSPAPAWSQLAVGPLFPPELFTAAEAAGGPAAHRPWREAVLSACTSLAPPLRPPTIVWHWQGTEPDAESDLVAGAWARGTPVEVVFQRTRGPKLVLPDAVLADLTLDLAVLRERQPQRFDLEGFIGKVRSLARLALSAAQAHRHFLKQTATPWPAFLLEQAGVRLRVEGWPALVPEVARDLGTTSHEEAELLLHQALARHLQPMLQAEGRTQALVAVVAPRVPWLGEHDDRDWVSLGRWLAPWGATGRVDWQPIPGEAVAPRLRQVARQTAVARLRINPSVHDGRRPRPAPHP